MSVKEALLVARLFDGAQHVHTAIISEASERLTLSLHIPAALQELDWDIAPEALKTLWKLKSQGSADYIPLSEWHDQFATKPAEENLVPRPGGEPLVIVRYVDYEHVKSF